LKRPIRRYCAELVKPFSEEEPADRRRPWQKREGLRRIAVLTAAPLALYALLVIISLLGGPRIGSPLIPLPNHGGVDAVGPVAGAPRTGRPTNVFPPIPADQPTTPAATTPPPTPLRQSSEPTPAASTAQSPTSTAGPQSPRTVDEPTWPRATASQSPPTNPPTDPPLTTPPPRPTPPPPTSSEPPGNPDDPQPQTLADTLLALLHQLGL
jgi:hypothetical protein